MASEAKGRGFDPRQPHQMNTSQRVISLKARMSIGIAGFLLSQTLLIGGITYHQLGGIYGGIFNYRQMTYRQREGIDGLE